MKGFIFSFVLFLSISAIAQNSETKSFHRVKQFFYSKSYICIEKHKTCIIFLDLDKVELNLADHLLPLKQIELFYVYYSDWGKSYYVQFRCIDGSCIYESGNRKYVRAFGVPFRTKSDCYKFINLVTELRKHVLASQN